MSDENERSVASAGSQPAMAIVSSDEAALRIIVRQQRSEIARLKEAIRRLAEEDATLSVCNGNVTVIMDATITAEQRDAIAYIALMHSRLKCDGHRPERTKQQDLDTVWGFLEQTR
jgi:methionine synthase II (cobalamin-independent)